MPTKLHLKNMHVTPEEYLELLRYHFEQVPTELIFNPELNFISCDSEKNETVLFTKKHQTLLRGVMLSPLPRPNNYKGDLMLKTLVRDKSKVN